MEEFSDVAPTVNHRQVAGVSRFEVLFDSAAGKQTKRIYANGRMQVLVVVLVSFIDEYGQSIKPTPDILDSLTLIHYNGGHNLDRTWKVSKLPNDYRHEMSGSGGRFARESGTDDDSLIRLDRWVSCTTVSEVAIGAALTLPNGVVKTNNTNSVPAGTDSHVGIEAIAPVHYALECFQLTKVEFLTSSPQTLIKWYLSLYVAGVKLPLRDWSWDGYDPFDYVSFYSNPYMHNSGTEWGYVVGVIAGIDVTRAHVWLPSNDPGRREENYYVPVNDKEGELNLIQGFSLWPRRNVAVMKAPFALTVYDEFGTKHELRLHTHEYDYSLTLH